MYITENNNSDCQGAGHGLLIIILTVVSIGRLFRWQPVWKTSVREMRKRLYPVQSTCKQC